MGAPHISIIMPVHNAADTLPDAVKSIGIQTFTDRELVIVDDGSTDASMDIAEHFTRQDARVRVIKRERCGIVEALMTGADAAQGNLYARMDADDVAEPARLEVQVALFVEMPELSLCGTRVRMFGNAIGSGRRRYESWINRLVRHEEINREIFVECPIPHPTFMMSREMYNRVGGYRDCGWPEDYDLMLRIWQQGGMFAKPEPVLLQWRSRSTRLSMTDERYSEKAFRALKRHFLSTTVLQGREEQFYQWGAGEVGKRWLREWSHPPQAVVDINPRKIGRTIHGAPVIAPDALPPPGNCYILIAVGTPGARDEIREYLKPNGYREPEHFRFIA